jgi:lipopolysaccharide transport system ATP-binding protein
VPHIRAEGLAVEFPLYHVGARSLKKRLLARTPLRLRQDESNRVVVAALRDLSFVINRGERVALVGGNGAGKTTLLRTLAGIYEPVAGRLEVAGSVGSLIDPAAGMDQVSTGRENIMLRALFRGMDDAEAQEMAEEVGRFSGLGEFLDVPVRSYSAGMQVRLSFAMATVIAPEVLLMDEWLLAGDADFMQRARSGWGAWWRAPTSWCWPPTTRRWRASGAPRRSGWKAGRIVADGPVAEVVDGMARAPAEVGG